MTQENGDAASDAPTRSHGFHRKDENVAAEQAEYRVFPRNLGRRLLFHQSNPHPSGGRSPGHLPPRMAWTRSQAMSPHQKPLGRVSRPAVSLDTPTPEPSSQPREPRIALPAGHIGAWPDDTETSEASRQVPHNGRIPAHRCLKGRVWLQAEGVRASRVTSPNKSSGSSSPPGRRRPRPVHSEGRRRCLEVEAELVHRRQERPHRPSGPGAVRREAHGATMTSRQRPRPDASIPA